MHLDLIFYISDGKGPLRSSYAGGLIFADIIENRTQVEDALADSIPALVINHMVKDLNVSYIAVDNIKGGEIAAEYLISLGHKRIATVTGNMQTQAGMDRYEGFQKTLMKRGVEFDPEYFFKGDYSRRSARDAALHFFSSDNPPTAIFAASDDMALEIISVAQEQGIKVPEDISVIGFDDNPAGLFGSVALTTIKQPLFAMGEEAVKIIYDIMQGKQTGLVRKILEPNLILRESCSPPSS
jgi:DNA-binding LacI/PurR family transcriptional regulator